MPSTLDSSAAPFTQAQIEFLAEREAGLEANRERRNAQHFRRFRNSALVGFLVLAGGIGAGFYTQGQDRAAADKTATQQRKAIVASGRAVSVDGCNRDYVTIDKLRNLLLVSQGFQKRAFKAGRITADQYAEAVSFYQSQLAALTLPDCRDALNVVTDDPRIPVRVPDPKFPPVAAPTHGNP